MDDSFPIILINKNIKKKGTLKELTLLDLERETNRLFREECTQCDLKFFNDDGQVQIEDDDDLEAEYFELNGGSDEDENDENDSCSDSSDNEEDRQKTALRIVLHFTVKKVEINAPKPTRISVTNIQSTTVILKWTLTTHTLDKKQISQLSFEMKQLQPQNAQILVAQCNPILSSEGQYEIKLCGLQPSTKYTFCICSVLSTHKSEYEQCSFNTNSIAKSFIPNSIEAPTDLQVIALYPDSVILAWNHNNTGNVTHDYEYYILEQDVFSGEICAATEDNNYIRIVQLSPSTQYTFVCKAKYYDPQRELTDLYYRKNEIISAPTNSVTITTPKYKTNINDYKTGLSIDKVRWIKRGRNELELYFSAPESFMGKIEYEIMDKIQKKVIGTANKLPVTISTGVEHKSIFGERSGKYVIGIRPILIDDSISEYKTDRVQCKCYDIAITIGDDEKEDNLHFSKSVLEFRVEYLAQNMQSQQRTIKIDSINCDFDTFEQKLLSQFKLGREQRLKISIRIPSEHSNSLETMQINNGNNWQSFINNYSQKLIRQQRPVYCAIECVMDAPQSLSVKINESSSQFQIDFQSDSHAQKYQCQIEAKFNDASVDLGMKYTQITATSKPILYTVHSGHKRYHFRFRVKCMESQYSQWTQWETLNRMHKSPINEHMNDKFAFPKEAKEEPVVLPVISTASNNENGSLQDLHASTANNTSEFWSNFGLNN